MSFLSELKAITDRCNIPAETGSFSAVPPDTYVVITPMADVYEVNGDNLPEMETHEARLSLFSKTNYLRPALRLCSALLKEDFTITERRYIEHENDTGYHHYAIDVEKAYANEALPANSLDE